MSSIALRYHEPEAEFSSLLLGLIAARSSAAPGISKGDDSAAGFSDLRSELEQVLLGPRAVEFMAFAERNKCTALVLALAERQLGSRLAAAQLSVLEKNRARVRTLVAAAREVSSALREASIASAAIEGGLTLVTSTLPDGWYGAGDIDLLVDEAGFARVPEVMAALGFEARDRRGKVTRRIEFSREREGSRTWIELGSASFDRMWVPLPLDEPCAEWLARRVSSNVSDIDALAPNDGLLQVCLHASMHSFVRSPGLRLYVDIDRAVTDRKVQWEPFVRAAVRTGAPWRVGVALAVAQGLLGTPAPLDAIDALLPRGWRRAGLERLLAGESVLGAGRKLPGARTVLLDVLLDPRPVTSWAHDVLLPPAAWLREHFARGSVPTEGVARLHARRYLNLALRWRPE